MQFLDVPGVYDYAGSEPRLAVAPGSVQPSPSVHRVGIPNCPSRSSIPCPPMPHVYASAAASRPPPQDWRSGGSLLLSCRTLSFPTACRFIPALGQVSRSHPFKLRSAATRVRSGMRKLEAAAYPKWETGPPSLIVTIALDRTRFGFADSSGVCESTDARTGFCRYWPETVPAVTNSRYGDESRPQTPHRPWRLALERRSRELPDGRQFGSMRVDRCQDGLLPLLAVLPLGSAWEQTVLGIATLSPRSGRNTVATGASQWKAWSLRARARVAGERTISRCTVHRNPPHASASRQSRVRAPRLRRLCGFIHS